VGNRGLDSSGSGYEHVAGPFALCNEPLGSINDGEFVE